MCIRDSTLSASDQASAEKQVDAMCDQLLANTVIENYRFEISANEAIAVS